MGNVSSTVQSATDIVENTSKQACELRQATDQNITARLDLTDTYCPDLQFINRSKMVGTCNMGQVAEALAQASTKLTKEQTAGLGVNLNVNSTVAERTNVIKNLLEARCANEGLIKQQLTLDLKGKNLSCRQLQAINDADLTTQCIANTVMQTLSSNEFAEASKQKTDILGGLTALLSAPILIMGGILLAIGLFFLMLRLGRGRAARADAEGTAAFLPSEERQISQAVQQVTSGGGTGSGGGGTSFKEGAEALTGLVSAAKGLFGARKRGRNR